MGNSDSKPTGREDCQHLMETHLGVGNSDNKPTGREDCQHLMATQLGEGKSDFKPIVERTSWHCTGLLGHGS